VTSNHFLNKNPFILEWAVSAHDRAFAVVNGDVTVACPMIWVHKRALEWRDHDLGPQVAIWECNTISLGIPLGQKIFWTSLGREVDDHLRSHLATVDILHENPLLLLGAILSDDGANSVPDRNVAIALLVVGVNERSLKVRQLV